MDWDSYLRSDGEKPFNTLQWYDVRDNEGDLFSASLEDAVTAWGLTNVTSQVRGLCKRVFDNRNLYKEIGAETVEAWKVMLDAVMDKEIFRFDKGLALYGAKDLTDTGVHSDTTGRTVFQDTPSGDLEGTYATNVTDAESHNTQDKGTNVDAANDVMDNIRNLVYDFVSRFDVCFMSTSARI